MLPLESLYQGRTLNLAHRGAREAAPENTLPAFERALELGADGFELDVHITFDDVPIVMHNFTLDETTDGEGHITGYTLEQIKAFDAGSHFAAEFAGTPIPTLAEALDAFPEAIVNIELKSLSLEDTGLERAVIDVVRQHSAEKRVILSSFNPTCLRRVRKRAPDLPIGHLTAGDLPIAMRQGWLLFGVKREAVHPHYEMVDERFVAAAHRKQRRVNVWTVNEPEDMKRMLELGVDAIITDVPDVFKAVLEGDG
ncbi:MAG: glycerophosphodiester phosphodiesterase [Anaerolineae bacterium]|nr:glycerophosphodiester phosphodiesterase [Anaerolineae bacterium]